VAAALNRPRGRPWRAGQDGEACVRRHGRTRVRVRLGHDKVAGMTGGPLLTAAAGAGARRWAGGDATGRLGYNGERGKRAAARASQAEETEGRRHTWLAGLG
jgi:hypothetical protein